MGKLNLLIADDSENFCIELASELQDSYIIHCCQDGKEALEYIRSMYPDVLVLDLMLTGLDGISLLHCITELESRPMVLATTRFVTDYIVQTTQELNVDYVMRKPCDAIATAERVRDLGKRLHPKQQIFNAETYAAGQIAKLSIAPHLRGFHCLKSAVIIKAQQPDISITKELYPKVGAAYGATGIQVERAIRNAIEYGWKHRDSKVWQSYFQKAADEASRPANGSFIARLADELRAEMTKQEQ